jgi:CMP/dCMP kinase
VIIAIDGPAGSGKTTTARALSRRLNILYLDTGATYRALTYAALESGVDPFDAGTLKKLAESLDLSLDSDRVYLNNIDISQAIRQPRIDKNISAIVVHPSVRAVMRALQRALAKNRDCVVEGRDTTTVVFPEAEYKFYLDADSSKRARRRFLEMKDKKISIPMSEVESDLHKRDSADRSRESGPLMVSDKAIIIDTTDLSIEETVEAIISRIDPSRLKVS